MADKIATRAAYGDAIVELAAAHPELVVLDADLSSATMTKKFSQTYPARFLNMGIAEANMMGVAAGLATCGKKAFCPPRLRHVLPPGGPSSRSAIPSPIPI